MMNGNSQSDFFPSGYGVPASGPMPHNPNSNPQRPGYATTAGLPSALQNGRRSQPSGPDMNSHSHTQQNGTPSLYSDDRFASFEPNNRFDRTSSAQSNLSAAYGVFGTNAPQQSTWGGYNGAGSAATMGGPMNDGSRIRPNNRRPPIHAEWTANNDQLGNPNGGHPNGGHMPYFPPLIMGGQQQMGMPSGMPSAMPSGIPSAASPDPFSVPPSVNVQNYGQADMRNISDNRKDMGDLIPTAIVIKNIPFNVRKEVLTNIMVELHLPQPYAFNYHFDNGVFRGLAFANFQSPTDTKHVIESMNGLDIHGRKLRVEYKKMLPEHERERIEREKREKRGQLEEQHRGPAHQVSISSMSAANNASRAPAALQSVPANVNVNVNDRNNMTQRPDMNDPNTLRYYVQLWMFLREDDREVIIFPSNISPEDRRVVHILAHNMGLEHTSIGEGDNRQIHVSKVKFSNGGAHPSTVQQLGVTVDGHPRGLSRAATFDFNDRQHHTHLNTINTRSQNLTIPSNSPDTQQHGMNGLRGVKSFADLRSVSPSPSLSHVSNNGGPSGTHQPNGIHGGGSAGGFMSHFPSSADSNAFGHSLTAHNSGSSVNLGSNMPSNMPSIDTSSISGAFSALGLGSSPFDSSSSPALGSGRAAGATVPGAIGSQRPSANGNSNGTNGSRANPERQPRGPAGDWEGGFSRARSNGHMHRSSDSSDNMNSNASANSAGRNGNGNGLY